MGKLLNPGAPGCPVILLRWRLLDLLALPLLLSLACGPPDQSGRTARSKGADSVEYVYVTPPREPSRRYYRLLPAWRWEWPDSGGEVPFGLVQDVLVDSAGRYYLLDYAYDCVHVLDRRGNLVGRLGHGGEGPGEFREPLDLFWASSDSIGIVFGRASVAIVPLDGSPGRTVTLESGSQEMMGLAGCASTDDGVVGIGWYARWRREGNNVRISAGHFCRSFDWTGRLVAEHWSNEFVFVRGAIRRDEVRDGLRPLVDAAGKQVFFCPQHLEYRIDVYSFGGGTERVIRIEHEHVRRTELEMEVARANLMREFEGTVEARVSEYRPDVYTLAVFGERIWVGSSSGWFGLPDSVAGVLDVLSVDGRFLWQAVLLGRVDPMFDEVVQPAESILVVLEGFDAAKGSLAGIEDPASTRYEGPVAVAAYRLAEIGEYPR